MKKNAEIAIQQLKDQQSKVNKLKAQNIQRLKIFLSKNEYTRKD